MLTRVRIAIPIVVLVAAVVRPAGIAGQEPAARAAPDAPAATVALVENWPDGRVIYELTGPRRASMWTPKFLRVDGYQLPKGATPVHAVQLARQLVADGIKVEIAVLFGAADPPRLPVATVLVTPGSRIVVDALARFGVQPITLSMIEVAPLTPYVPTVVSVSPDVEVTDVEVRSAPYPGYRIASAISAASPCRTCTSSRIAATRSL